MRLEVRIARLEARAVRPQTIQQLDEAWWQRFFHVAPEHQELTERCDAAYYGFPEYQELWDQLLDKMCAYIEATNDYPVGV